MICKCYKKNHPNHHSTVGSPIKASGPPTVVYTAQTASAPWPFGHVCLEDARGPYFINHRNMVI